MNDARKGSVPATRIRKMYYTFCADPACGAINDYADTRAEAEKNRKRHAALHRNGATIEHDPVAPSRREVENWAAP